MQHFTIPTNIFWVEKENLLQVVKTDDSRIFNLEGIAAKIFLAIAKSETVACPNEELKQKVLTDLASLNLIKSS